MTFSQSLITIFEVAMVALVIWCIFHEDRLVAFEERLLSRFRRKQLHIVKREEYHRYNSSNLY